MLALLAALMVVGGLSDHLGRRPVLAGALVVELVAMLAFLLADGTAWLLVARVVQGLATGAATGVLSAALLDLAPPGRPGRGPLVSTAAPALGLATGSLVAGLLVELAPAPTRLVFALLIVVFVAGLGAVAAMPESASRRPGALRSLRPDVAVPARARRPFLLVAPVLTATWALGGLYLSLGPSLTEEVLDLRSRLAGGLVITALAGVGVVSSVVASSRPPRRIMAVGALALVVGVSLTLLAVAVASAPLLYASTAVSGIGFGAGFLGVVRTLGPLAEVHERGGLFSAIFVVAYLAFSLPAVAAGLAVGAVGLRSTALVYGGVVVALALVTLVGLLRERRRDVVAPRPQVDPAA